MTHEIELHRRTAMERAKYAGEKMAGLQEQINALSTLRREAVRELGQTMTYREIAAELGISSPRVSQILGDGWRKPQVPHRNVTVDEYERRAILGIKPTG